MLQLQPIWIFARDCPNKRDQPNINEEEEETTYSNDSHIDSLCASEEECAMVAQDSPSSEDLDDPIVTFGQQNSEKENFEKTHDESLLYQESSSEEKMSCNYSGKPANESAYITKHPREKVPCREQSMWHEGDDDKTAFRGEPNKKYQSKILIKKESGEEEYFGSTDEPQESNLIMSNNPFIDQEMNCETTNKNDETSETSKVTLKKKNSEHFYMPA